jgi:hypothetical protein
VPKKEAFNEIEVVRSDVVVPSRRLGFSGPPRTYDVVLATEGVPNPLLIRAKVVKVS